ncbi:SGNH/GDSL hydrolase family protein [Elizabethkingia miricola]|uniref:SGNH/GDSL hydrolase family protein n=1 Tax=Elizabethkingia miricola TaxID=172045 RepID=UPI000B34D076|nr:SGNH/GDSL hydrolase family protein [Elizabethkingia miricola]
MDNNNNDISAFIIPKPIQDLPEVQGPTLIGNFVVEENGKAKRLSSDKINRIINTGISGDLDKVTSVPTTGYYKYDVFVAKTYTNVSPNITVSPTELKNNVVYVVVDNGVSYKILQEKLSPDTSDLVTKEEFQEVKDRVDIVISIDNPTLVFDKGAFRSDLTENPDIPNSGATIDVNEYAGSTADITTNAFQQLWCGFKDTSGNFISNFQTSTDGSVHTVTKDIPSNAKTLCVSKFGSGTVATVVLYKKDYSKAIVNSETALKTADLNKSEIDNLNKYTGFKRVFPPLTYGKFYKQDLTLETFNSSSQYSEVDVSGMQGFTIDLYTKNSLSVYCGFVDINGVFISSFQTGAIFKAYSVDIPKNAWKLRMSNYDADDIHNDPYFVITNRGVSDLSIYTKNFNFEPIKSFFEKLTIGKNTPIKLMFAGDSITNFQYTLDDTNYLTDSLNRPMSMYNKNTFTFRIWQYLNPNSLNDYNGSVISETGNMTFIKANNTSVTKTGTWISNINSYAPNYVDYNTLGSYFSDNRLDIQEIFHSKTSGDSMSITVPAGSFGFTVTGFKFSGSKTYDGFSSTASTMKIYIDNVLKDTVSLVGEDITYFEYKFDSPLTSSVVVKMENAENKWLPVWGFDVWKSNRIIRPTKLAVSGGLLSTLLNQRMQYALTNYTPDLVIHEAHLINEKGYTQNQILTEYDAYVKDMKSKNIPLIFIITHSMAVPDDNFRLNAIALMKVLKANNIPYVNVWKFLDDKYNGGRIPDKYYIDSAHLANPGHDVYVNILKNALNNKY